MTPIIRSRKTWVVTLDIVNSIYSYTYPFAFRTYQNKYDLQVRIQILKTFDCSFARFKELATECVEIKESGV